MQMPLVRMQWMLTSAWVCNECKCLLESMSWCECPLESMSWHECPLVGMQWMQMPSCGYIMTWNALVQTQFIQKFLLFSTWGFHNAWNQNIFKLDLLFMKSHLPFDLRLPKKLVITVRKSLNGAFTWNLMIWLKRLISTIWLSKEMVHFQSLFFWKNEFFENQAS